MASPRACDVFRHGTACLTLNDTFAFPCRKTNCTGLGRSCPFAAERPVWLYVAPSAAVVFLLLAALYTVRRNRHHEPAVGLAQVLAQGLDALWTTAQQALPPQEQERYNTFQQTVHAGGGEIVTFNGAPYSCGYSASTTQAAASSAWQRVCCTPARCWRRLQDALFRCQLRASTHGLVACLPCCVQLRTPALSNALLGAQRAWVLVGLLTSIATLVTLAKQTQHNTYRVHGSGLLLWTLIQGWLVWLLSFIGTTFSSSTLVFAFRGALKHGGLTAVAYAMYSFGMMAIVTVPCDAPRSLARFASALVFLQAALLPLQVVSSWLRGTLETTWTYDILEVARPYALTEFPDEPVLLQHGYYRVSATLRLPGSAFEPRSVGSCHVSHSESGFGHMEHTSRHMCCWWREVVTVCNGDPAVHVMEWRTYRLKWVRYLAWPVLRVADVGDLYCLAIRLASAALGVWICSRSAWYLLVVLCPAVVGGVLFSL